MRQAKTIEFEIYFNPIKWSIKLMCNCSLKKYTFYFNLLHKKIKQLQ